MVPPPGPVHPHQQYSQKPIPAAPYPDNRFQYQQPPPPMQHHQPPPGPPPSHQGPPPSNSQFVQPSGTPTSPPHPAPGPRPSSQQQNRPVQPTQPTQQPLFYQPAQFPSQHQQHQVPGFNANDTTEHVEMKDKPTLTAPVSVNVRKPLPSASYATHAASKNVSSERSEMIQQNGELSMENKTVFGGQKTSSVVWPLQSGAKSVSKSSPSTIVAVPAPNIQIVPAPSPMRKEGSTAGRNDVRNGVSSTSNRRRDKANGPPATGSLPGVDFDFEKSNAKFDKANVMKQMNSVADNKSNNLSKPSYANTLVNGSDEINGEDKSNAAPAYNSKTSFFDSLDSTGPNDTATNENAGSKRNSTTTSRSSEWHKNVETFGEGRVENGYATRSRGRGRGRGGRGSRGRGRGKGRDDVNNTTSKPTTTAKNETAA